MQICFDAQSERVEPLGEITQERYPGSVATEQLRPFGKLRLAGRGTDQNVGETTIVANGSYNSHPWFGVPDQQKDGGRAALNKRVTHGCGAEHAHIEFD